jgi:hypothetical protein
MLLFNVPFNSAICNFQFDDLNLRFLMFKNQSNRKPMIDGLISKRSSKSAVIVFAVLMVVIISVLVFYKDAIIGL